MPLQSVCHINSSVYKEEESVYLPINDPEEDEDVYVQEYTVAKSIPYRQIVFGWASIAMLKDGTIPLDWQDDIIPIPELETMAYNYVEFYGQSGVQHQGEPLGHVIESMAFTPDKMEALGIPEGTVHYGWWIGFHVPDIDVYEKIKNGELKQFSIQGAAKRIQL